MNTTSLQADVVVVGGGPAGSTCARELTRAGLEVLIVDKARFPRDKVCAGWITPAVVDALQLDLEAYRQGRTLQPFEGFRTSALGGREIRTHYGTPISYGIRRCEFDHYLLQQSGARWIDSETVHQIEGHDTHWILNGHITARFLIGAGGQFCPVARHLNPEPDDRLLVTAQEGEFPLSPAQQAACRIEPALPALDFCPDRCGYGWAVRKGDYLNVGFGRLKHSAGAFSEHVRDFQAFLNREGLVPTDLPNTWKGHAYTLYGLPRRRRVGHRVLLAGDSAGLAHPVSGEGIRAAVESGLLAARTVLQTGLEASEAALSAYEDALRNRYGRPAPATASPAWVPEAWVSRVGSLLMGSRWFARHVLLDRWFLHRHRAPLN